jgi:hypothetical protein
MLIVVPSLIILGVASAVVIAINVFKKDEEHEKKTVKEDHIYNKNFPEASK